MGIDMAQLLTENARDIVTDCKINNQLINDETLIENFCPGLEAFNGTTPNLQEIFGKLQTSDPTFLTKAALEFLEMKQTARDKLKEIYNIRSDYDLAQILAVFPEKTSSLIRVITRALLRLSSKEVTAVVDLLEKDSHRMTICGSHTTTLSCEFQDKDFCHGNSISLRFGLTVLCAMCLPGLVKGLSNLIFHQVGGREKELNL